MALLLQTEKPDFWYICCSSWEHCDKHFAYDFDKLIEQHEKSSIFKITFLDKVKAIQIKGANFV